MRECSKVRELGVKRIRKGLSEHGRGGAEEEEDKG